jgi:ATP-dependent exoDNAse (exonuclease V) beta subunit
MQLSVYKSSAGSGKTFTLVKDFLTLALASKKPELVRNILALTFTNKAAQEMKDRILESLSAFSKENVSGKSLALLDALIKSKKLNLPEEEIKNRSKKLLNYILHNYSSFSVSTIDKFNYRLIQTFAQDLGVSSNAEVELDELELLEESINVLLKESATNEVLSEWLTDFLISQLNEDKSWNIKRHFIDFSKITLNENDQFLIDQLSELELSDFTIILKNIRKKISKIEIEAKALSKIGYDLLEAHDIDPLNFFGGKNSMTIFFRNLSLSTFEKFPNPGIIKMLDKEDWSMGKAPADQKEKIAASQDEFALLINKSLEFGEREIEKWIVLKALLKNIHGVGLLSEVRKKFKKLTEELNVIPISTFNRNIANVVRNEPSPYIYERLGNRYRNFLLDEFQDTSKMQWHNLLPLVENGLSTEGQSLIVGDAKQAIYRWRGGDADQFVYLPKIIDPNADELTNERSSLLEQYIENKTLDSNWRSCEEIVNFNNNFFSGLAKLKGGLIADVYKSVEQVPQKKDTSGYINYSLIPAEIEENELEEELSQEERMFAAVFNKIQTLINADYSKGDIAILCRSNKQISALSQYLEPKIDIVTSEGLLLFSHPSSLLLHTAFKHAQLNGTLTKNEQTIKTNLSVQLILLLNKLGKIASEHVHDYLSSITEDKSETNLALVLASLGVDYKIEEIQGLTIYQQLLGLCRIFHLSKKPSPYVILLLEKTLEYPENKDAIKIMTIHKAKGLEFPAVIFPFANTLVKSDAKLWVNSDYLDVGLPFGLINSSLTLERTKFSEIYESEKAKTWLDSINTYYVAFTRAENALFIIAHEYKRSKSDMRSIYQPILEQYPEFNKEKNALELGQLIAPENTKKDKSNAIETEDLETIYTENWLENIAIAPTVKTDITTLSPSEYGDLVHELMRSVTNSDQYKNQLKTRLSLNAIDSETKEKIESGFESLFNNKIFKGLFDTPGQRYLERDMIASDGKIIRPDCVIMGNENVILMDYKTGVPEPSHEKQILEYKNNIEVMQKRPVKAYLVYTENAEIKSVN